MIDTTIYQDLLSTLDKTIAQQKIEVEKLIINAEKEGQDVVELQNLKRLADDVQNALNEKDLNALNKIISDASNIKG